MKRLKWWWRPNTSSPDVDLRRYFTALKDEEYQDSIQPVQAWIRRAEQQRRIPSSIQSKVTTMMNRMHPYRMRVAVASVLLAASFVACSIPVEQEETLGYMISGTVDETSAKQGEFTIAQVLDIEPGQVTYSERVYELASGDVERQQHFTVALPQATEGQALSGHRKLESMGGFNGISVQPLQEHVKRSVFGAAMQSLHLANEGGFEVKYEQAIKKYLDAHNLSDVTAGFYTKPNGDRVLLMQQKTQGESLELKEEVLSPDQLEELQRSTDQILHTLQDEQ